MTYTTVLKKKSPLLFGLIIILVYFSIYYTPLIISPNSYLLASDADGLKNYYTYTYYIQNDSSFVNTHAVNYPYGEHFAYTDSQPALSILLKGLNLIFPFIGQYSIGILNLLLFFSSLIAFVLIFLIFVEYKLNKWFAAYAAVGIILLSPQFYRLYGHYSLFYLWYIPAAWYAHLKFFQQPNLKVSTYIILFILITFFIHNYAGMIVASLFFVSSLLRYLFHIRHYRARLILNILLIFVIPLLLNFLIITLTDKHSDRTTSPAGFFVYTSSFELMFLPSEHSHYTFYKWIAEFRNRTPYEFEGTSFVGTCVNLTILILVIWLIIQLVLRKFQNIRTIVDREILIILIICTLYMLISFEKPIEGLFLFITDFVPTIKQFRALGRFAWVCYYLLNIGMIIVLYRLFLHYKVKSKWALLFLLPSLFLLYEGTLFQNNFSRFFLKNHNIFNEKLLNNEIRNILKQLKNESFQAIIPLPFFHYGSDDFIKEPESQNSRYYATILAYHLQKPLVASNSGRTSITETRKIFEILLPEFYQKTYQKDVRKEPFLILYPKKDSLIDAEKRLLYLSKPIAETEHLIIKKISYEDLFQYNIQKPLNEYLSYNDSIYYKNGLLVSDTTAFVYFNTFDDQNNEIYLSKPASLKGNKTLYSHLAHFTPGMLKTNETYSVSFWYYNRGNSRTHNIVVVEESDENELNAEWIVSTDPRFSTTIVNDWSMIELSFTVKSPNNHYKIFFIPMKTWQDTFFVDNLLVRPNHVSVFKVYEKDKKGVLFYNNHLIETNIPYAILDNRNEIVMHYYLNKIKNDKQWYRYIMQEAQKLNISFNDNLLRHARYMTTETFLKPIDEEGLKIAYYVSKIKSTPEWYQHIVNKPENKGKNLDSLLLENAKFVLNN